METAQRQRWSVIALDVGIDMTTPTERMVAGVTASLAQWKREIIAGRSRDAMRAKKQAGGVRYGHRSTLDC